MQQYFIYGLLITFHDWLGHHGSFSIADAMNLGDVNDDIRGLFTGRDGDFIIIGKVLNVEPNENNYLRIPELEDVDKKIVEDRVFERYGFKGEFHYYFVTK